MRADIGSVQNQEERKEKKKKVNEVKGEIRQRQRKNEEDILEKQLAKLEETKNDSNRYHRVLREMQYKKPKALQIKDKNNCMAGTEEKQAEIITNYFKKMFSPSEEIEIKTYPPAEMIIPFDGREVGVASKGLKDGKSGSAVDNFNAEYIKYADISIHQETAEIFNEVARSGKYPEELKLGILTGSEA